MKSFFATLTLGLLLASAAPAVFAQTGPTGNPDIGPTGNYETGSGQALQNPLGEGKDLNDLVRGILEIVVRIGSIVVVFMLVYVGFLFVKARGEPGAIAEARQALLWTVIGALVLLGAVAISAGIEATVRELSGGS